MEAFRQAILPSSSQIGAKAVRVEDATSRNPIAGGARFIRFLVTGCLAAAVNIGARAGLSLAMPFELAIVVAFLFGVTTAYALARIFVFDKSGHSVKTEFFRFVFVNLVMLIQVWIVSVGLAKWLFPAINFDWHRELVAHTIGVVSPVASSYYAHKLFTFRRAPL